MATTHDIRRLAFQALYQLDARPGEPAHDVLESMATDNDEGPGGGTSDHSAQSTHFTPPERRRAFDLATRAFEHRATADAFLVETAPTWPTHRQAAVDRAILRLAHYEMTAKLAPLKVIIDEAIELAKAYSTDKSAAFVNGVLDKLLRDMSGLEGGDAVAPAPASSPSPVSTPASETLPPGGAPPSSSVAASNRR